MAEFDQKWQIRGRKIVFTITGTYMKNRMNICNFLDFYELSVALKGV
jgi:hypothetical protein